MIKLYRHLGLLVFIIYRHYHHIDLCFFGNVIVNVKTRGGNCIYPTKKHDVCDSVGLRRRQFNQLGNTTNCAETDDLLNMYFASGVSIRYAAVMHN